MCLYYMCVYTNIYIYIYNKKIHKYIRCSISIWCYNLWLQPLDYLFILYITLYIYIYIIHSHTHTYLCMYVSTYFNLRSWLRVCVCVCEWMNACMNECILYKWMYEVTVVNMLSQFSKPSVIPLFFGWLIGILWWIVMIPNVLGRFGKYNPIKHQPTIGFSSHCSSVLWGSSSFAKRHKLVGRLANKNA